MKFKSILFLVVFVGFLITPAIISCVEKDSNISMFFSLNEEENHSKVKIDIEKFQYNNQQSIPIVYSDSSENVDNFHSLDNWNTIYFETVSPPPELSVFIG